MQKKKITKDDFDELERLIHDADLLHTYALMPGQGFEKYQESMRKYMDVYKKMWEKFHDMRITATL